MAKKIYVLDTSVYLTDYKSIFSYGNNDIYVPLIVLEELDQSKKEYVLKKAVDLYLPRHQIY